MINFYIIILYNTYISRINQNITLWCIDYKHKERCNAFIITNNNNIAFQWNNEHNHLPDKLQFQRKRTKSEIKVKINNTANFYLCNAGQIYKEVVVNSDSNLLPAFNSIKSAIYRQINKDIPPEPNNVEDIPDDFPGFITYDNKPFLIFRDKDLIILQSEKMATILDNYPKELFADATFKICPFYQMLILRVYDSFHNAFHTICFVLMKQKTKFLYKKALVMIKCNYKKLFKSELKGKLYIVILKMLYILL